jgi:hypothetical protein
LPGWAEKEVDAVMSEIAAVSAEPRITDRKDARGKWHRAASTPCEACGCMSFYSVDHPGIVWEAGPDIEPECLDDMCECHVMPVMGQVFRLNLSA